MSRVADPPRRVRWVGQGVPPPAIAMRWQGVSVASSLDKVGEPLATIPRPSRRLCAWAATPACGLACMRGAQRRDAGGIGLDIYPCDGVDSVRRTCVGETD